MIRKSMLVLLSGVFLSGSLQAHHTTSGIYKEDETITVTGKVKQWRLINPHPHLILEVEDESGNVNAWDVSYGGAAVVHLQRLGYTTETFQEGEVITFEGHPARAAGAFGLLVEGGNAPKRADGTPVVEGGSMF